MLNKWVYGCDSEREGEKERERVVKTAREKDSFVPTKTERQKKKRAEWEKQTTTCEYNWFLILIFLSTYL